MNLQDRTKPEGMEWMGEVLLGSCKPAFSSVASQRWIGNLWVGRASRKGSHSSTGKPRRYIFSLLSLDIGHVLSRGPGCPTCGSIVSIHSHPLAFFQLQRGFDRYDVIRSRLFSQCGSVQLSKSFGCHCPNIHSA